MTEEKQGQTEVIPHLIILYFCLRASINFTTICLPIGRKVRAAPTSTKEAFKPSENIVTFHFEHILKRKIKEKNIYIWSVVDV